MTMKITTGKIKKPHLVLLYGIDGVGKSTWASRAPAPIFLGPEEGTNNLDVSRFADIRSWSNIMSALAELKTENHSYQTLVFDTLDWMELMLWTKILGNSSKNINTVNGGYGAGRESAKKEFMDLIQQTSYLRNYKNMNIIFLAHSNIEMFNDPSLNESYNRYQMKLDWRVAGLMREYCDDVLFATFKAYIKKEESGPAKTFSDGVRVVFTERRPAHDASNRHGLPFEISLNWNEYIKAKDLGEPEKPEVLVRQIHGLLEGTTDEDLKKTVTGYVETYKNNAVYLSNLKNRVEVRLAK